jgi:hypothetical protein
MRDHGYTFGEASDRVILEFLGAGDVRPLVDLLRRGRMEPSERVCQYVAAMLNGDGRTPFRFGFKEARKRGRPASHMVRDDRVNRATALILSGARTISEGGKPGWRFWNSLLQVLDHSRILVGRKPHDFPLMARIFPGVGEMERRSDPALRIREKLLARIVQERIDGGDRYEAAVTLTLEAIKNVARAERWDGNLSLTTVRNAYDRARKQTDT